MGASAWSYLVAYDSDVNRALEALRWEVFRSGKYYKLKKPTTFRKFEDFVPPDPDIWNDPDELESWREMYEEAKKRAKAPDPKSPDDALAQSETEGTHSIIDIQRVTSSTSLTDSGPLSSEKLHELFGTDKPTEAMVRAKARAIQEARGRWYSTYVIVYADGVPSALFFAGITGD